VRLLVPLLAVAAAAACAGDADGAATTGAATDTTIDTDTTAPVGSATATSSPTTEVAPAPGAELVGRWAHYDVVAYEDDLLKTLIISYGFNDFAEADGQIVDQASFCFSEQRTDQPIRTSLSDAATQAIEPPPVVVELETVDGELRIHRPPTPTPVGIRLDDPFNEALPTDPADPRIVDDDGDGQPGITVTIEVSDDLSGELYIARREIFSYDARLVEPDRITGVVTDESEQLVIGASDPAFAISPANWRQHPDLSKSPMILVRVDDDWDCDRLAVERDELFPPTPEVDW
jgi:hypothetical protein